MAPDSKAVVWAHNSHVGDAAATEMSSRGEHNLGQLCRKEFGTSAYLIGFGTHRGTVAAASDWDGPMEIKNVRPSLPDKLRAVVPRGRHARPSCWICAALRRSCARSACAKPRLERAIGVIYRPRERTREPLFPGDPAAQFDEYIWFDRTGPVQPFETQELEDMPDTYPFGL